MFFRRKKKKSEELREHYRRAPGKKHALGLSVQVAGGSPVQATIENLSAGGTGFRFSAADAAALTIDTEVNLTFTSLGPGRQVVAPGLIVGVRGAAADGLLYGVQFRDVAGLFAQLDTSLLRFFNRRKAMRVLPALGKTLPIDATVSNESVRMTINDLSWMGLSFLLDPANAEKFMQAREFDVDFSLSKGGPKITTPVRLVHKTLTGAKVLFGGCFVNPDQKAGDEQRRLLEEFAKAREKDMARWDATV